MLLRLSVALALGLKENNMVGAIISDFFKDDKSITIVSLCRFLFGEIIPVHPPA